MPASSASAINTPSNHIGATPAENLRGSLFMMAGMAGFAVNDTIVKAVGQSLNLGQTLFIRGLFATCFLFLLAWLVGHLRPLRQSLSPLMALRVAGDMAATFAFVTALFHMPIANVAALLQALPLAITAATAIVFGERVGWRRMSAIALGFLGVIIIIRPGMAGFSAYSLLMLACVAACVVRDLATRAMPPTIPTMMITLLTAFGVMAMGGFIALFEDWNPASLRETGLLALSGVFVMAGYGGVAAAMRVGEVALVSPFRYCLLPFAALGGFVAFGDVPDLLTIIGAAIIVTTGVYTLYRGRDVRHTQVHRAR